MLNSGLSDTIGSCRIIAIERPRMRRISRAVFCVRSSPRKLIRPPAARIAGGRINFLGEDLTQKTAREMRRIRGRSIAMILQDPMVSLNPLFSIYRQVAEPAYYHQGIRG